MAWTIITIYTSKCAQMDRQQLPKKSKFYSKCKKCDIEKTLGVSTTPFGSPKVKISIVTVGYVWAVFLRLSLSRTFLHKLIDTFDDNTVIIVSANDIGGKNQLIHDSRGKIN